MLKSIALFPILNLSLHTSCYLYARLTLCSFESNYSTVEKQNLPARTYDLMMRMAIENLVNILYRSVLMFTFTILLWSLKCHFNINFAFSEHRSFRLMSIPFSFANAFWQSVKFLILGMPVYQSFSTYSM